jgi:regulator of RNase E activity RraB
MWSIKTVIRARMTLRRSLPLLSLAALVALATPRSNSEDMMSSDAETLKALAEAGSDLRKLHLIDYWIFFQDESGARAAAKDLVASGFFVVSLDKDPEDSEWRLLARKEMVPRLEDVEKTSALVEALARRNNGDYDGWETQVSD